ncbi:MAG: hypothetical protein N3A61_09860, partial [Ignavibacteria bacterium]|nr:hypothetical protein [Ignavibacteria bacterium]
AIDHSISDVRACLYDSSTKEVTEISSNNSFLPNWLGDDIIFNFGNHIWKTDVSISSQKIFFEGFKPIVSKRNKFIAAYTRKGIIIADSLGSVIKEIEVNYWSKITPTFAFDESIISYFDPERQACYLFDWKKEINKLFGSSIYHPTWSSSGDKILFNYGKIDENFRICLVDSSWKEGDEYNFITPTDENAIVPIWSPFENVIAFMVIDVESRSDSSDLIPGKIYFYNTKTESRKLIAEDAGFTEGDFPQFCFDNAGNYFYYTAINKKGNGTIVQLDLKNNFQKTYITTNQDIDYRLPRTK